MRFPFMEGVVYRMRKSLDSVPQGTESAPVVESTSKASMEPSGDEDTFRALMVVTTLSCGLELHAMRMAKTNRIRYMASLLGSKSGYTRSR
jgi:hypothetical protein